MTWRGAGLLLVPVAVIASGAAVPGLFFAGLVLLVACIGAIAVDSRRAPGRSFDARRSSPDFS